MIIEPDQAYQDRLMADLSREADMQIVGVWADLLGLSPASPVRGFGRN